MGLGGLARRVSSRVPRRDRRLLCHGGLSCSQCAYPRGRDLDAPPPRSGLAGAAWDGRCLALHRVSDDHGARRAVPTLLGGTRGAIPVAACRGGGSSGGPAADLSSLGPHPSQEDLAHIPFFGRYVEPLGYRSILYFQSVTAVDLPTQLWSVARFGRRYESWVVAAAGIGVVTAMMWRRNTRLVSSRLPPGLGVVAGLGLWLLVCHFVMFRLNFKWVIAYFPGFAPTVAVVLGVLAAVLWQRSDLTVAGRGVLATSLVLACTVSVVSMRIPMLLTRPLFLSATIRSSRSTGRRTGSRSWSPPASASSSLVPGWRRISQVGCRTRSSSWGRAPSRATTETRGRWRVVECGGGRRSNVAGA